MSLRLRPLFVSGLALLLLSAAALYALMRGGPAPVEAVASDPAEDVIACLGRISPDGGDVVRVSARAISGQPSIVADLRVAEGASVKRGEILALLNSRPQLEAAWRAATAQYDVAQRRLAQVKAGVKPADLAAQNADIARLEAELANADTERQRSKALHEAGLIATNEFDAKQLAADAKAQSLRQSRERLNSLAEVRDVDVALAEAEAAAAGMRAKVAQSEFEQTEIRSPFSGRVVEIHAWPGEEVTSAGILELARVDRMYVVAEVSERDIARVRPGQAATVTGEALTAPLRGVVERLGSKVAKNDVLHVDPTAMSDSRVVETWIRLDAPDRAAGLIHGQVTVRITP